jgi:uncharacterized DUF497 family protein
MLEFEWDDDKAASNLVKHGVAFADAARLFDDIHALHFIDRSMNHGEERLIGVGMVNGIVLTVVYTERGERIRLISARKATRHEQRSYDQEREG